MATKKKAKKKTVKKKAAGPTIRGIKDPMTKSQLYTEIAERTE